MICVRLKSWTSFMQHIRSIQSGLIDIKSRRISNRKEKWRIKSEPRTGVGVAKTCVGAGRQALVSLTCVRVVVIIASLIIWKKNQKNANSNYQNKTNIGYIHLWKKQYLFECEIKNKNIQLQGIPGVITYQ